MRSSQRSPLLVSTNKPPKTDSKWTTQRSIFYLVVGIGSLILLYNLLIKLKVNKTGFIKKEKDAVIQSRKSNASPTGLYALGTIVDIYGHERDLAEFTGNVSIVVNVASYCGFTEINYKGLQELYEKYKDHGFTILAFPCNQFGHQEPDPNDAIQHFAQSKYNITFPLFAKVEVNGPKTHKIFAYLKAKLPYEDKVIAFDPQFNLGWNFQKFLVNQDGKPVQLFKQDFNKQEMESAILHLLNTSFLK